MYDTIHLNYDIVESPSTISERVFLHTDNTTVTEYLESKDRWVKGDLGNLTVSMTQHTVSVKGSICKYNLGNNLYTLNRATTKEAIESISEAVGLDMGKARVSRLDWSTNITTNLPPNLYMPKLGDLSRFSRLENPNSIYYNQSTKRLLFYDKMKEAKKKRVVIPDEFKGKNLLRYEMVLDKGVNQYLNTDVRGGILHREDIFQKMADLWYNYYKSINKLNDKGLNINMDKIKTEGDFEKALLAGLLQNLGMEEVNYLIEQMKAKGVYRHNEYYSRLKSKFRKMCKVNIEEEDIISEINKKIEEVYMNLM
jgi:hypothetical protein